MSLQVSAYISDETKENMENYSALYGVKKGFLIENALDHYLQALQEIPSEFIVPTKLVVTEESFQKVLDAQDDEPSEALKELMRGH